MRLWIEIISLLSILVSTPAGVDKLRRWGVTIIKKWRRKIFPTDILNHILFTSNNVLLHEEKVITHNLPLKSSRSK